jgi:hypothetical protein
MNGRRDEQHRSEREPGQAYLNSTLPGLTAGVPTALRMGSPRQWCRCANRIGVAHDRSLHT